MKGELEQHHLDFFQEAKREFEENDYQETYRDENDEFIALRYGMDRDCIKVFKLDGEVAFLHNIIDGGFDK